MIAGHSAEEYEELIRSTCEKYERFWEVYSASLDLALRMVPPPLAWSPVRTAPQHDHHDIDTGDTMRSLRFTPGDRVRFTGTYGTSAPYGVYVDKGTLGTVEDYARWNHHHHVWEHDVRFDEPGGGSVGQTVDEGRLERADIDVKPRSRYVLVDYRFNALIVDLDEGIAFDPEDIGPADLVEALNARESG